MKKLLVLMMVLGMVSLAYAANIELSIDGVTDGDENVTEYELDICDEIVIDIFGAVDYDWLGYLMIESSWPGAGGEWGDDLNGDHLPICSGYYYLSAGYPQILAGAGDMASVTRYEEAGWGFGYEITAASSPGSEPTGGREFNFIYHCCGPECEYVTITLYDDADWTIPADTIVIHQVPEPMTMALLGLGGLFLLRRRK